MHSTKKRNNRLTSLGTSRRAHRRRLGERLEDRRVLTVDFMVHDIGPTSNAYTDSMRTADFDGDGDLDFAFAQNSTDENGVQRAILSWYENIDGEGTFDEVQNLDDNLVAWIEVADMDGDGDVDIVSSSYDGAAPLDTPGTIAWYENDQGFFGEPQVVADNLFAPYFDLADVDGDGDIDIVSGAVSGVAWMENDGGTFTQNDVTAFGQELPSFAVSVDDLDGDGDNDVVWSIYGAATVGWSENTDGLGTFGNDELLDTNAQVVADLATFDVDGDADIDVVIPDQTDLSIVRNTDGQGTFAKRLVASGGFFVVEPADVDGDGDLDLVTDRDESVVWFENRDGALTNPAVVESFGGRNLLAVHPADLDGDGDVDLLVNAGNFDDNGGRILWYENLSAVERVIGDSNGDGRFDSSDLVAVFVVGEYEDGIEGNSTFEEGDWNEDGDFDTSDLVFAFQNSVYEIEPPAPARAAAPIDGSLIDRVLAERTKKQQRVALGDTLETKLPAML